MKKFNFCLFLFLFLTKLSLAQDTKKVVSEIERTLSSIIDGKNLKDSIALYTLSIQISIKKSKGKTIVNNISYNDNIATIIFKDLNKLKEIDYSSLTSVKRNVFINIPVAYIVANYKKNDISEKKITLSGLQDSLYKLFNCAKNDVCDSEKYIYLKPFIITSDRAIYN